MLGIRTLSDISVKISCHWAALVLPSLNEASLRILLSGSYSSGIVVGMMRDIKI